MRQIFGLHTPEEIGGITDGGETASSTHVEENAFSQTTLHMLNDLEILVLGMLDIPARCNFAQTCRGNRAVVQTWRKREIETIFSNEKLRRLFPFFFIHAPYVLHPESFDLWPSEWASRTLPAIIQQITRTQLLLDSEKKSLLRFSDPKAAKDFDAIKKLLQASYDISLVTAFEEVMCPWISGQSTMFLSEKVTAAKAFFQQLDDSYVGFHIAPDAARPCSCMTCVPEEIFLQVPLCTLHFSKSSILTIPESLRFSSKLKHLVLSHNKLIDVPDFIGRMSQLVTITLSYNQIKTLPKSFGSLINLEELDLSGNPIESLPDSFQSLTKLQTLQLLQVNLDASFCHKLPPGLNVFIDSKHRFHPINMYKTFPRHVQIHYGAKEK